MWNEAERKRKEKSLSSNCTKVVKNVEERKRKSAPNPATLDNLVGSYDPLGSYGGPILTHTLRENIYNFMNFEE